MVKIYTAQYRYNGDDRLDITAKGKDPIGRLFAPSWKIVMGCKEEKISWQEYKEMYKELMRDLYKLHKDVWGEILNRDEVTLVCFCQTGTDCHRYLLADYFVKLGAEYVGERNI